MSLVSRMWSGMWGRRSSSLEGEPDHLKLIQENCHEGFVGVTPTSQYQPLHLFLAKPSEEVPEKKSKKTKFQLHWISTFSMAMLGPNGHSGIEQKEIQEIIEKKFCAHHCADVAASGHRASIQLNEIVNKGYSCIALGSLASLIDFGSCAFFQDHLLHSPDSKIRDHHLKLYICSAVMECGHFSISSPQHTRYGISCFFFLFLFFPTKSAHSSDLHFFFEKLFRIETRPVGLCCSDDRTVSQLSGQSCEFQIAQSFRSSTPGCLLNFFIFFSEIFIVYCSTGIKEKLLFLFSPPHTFCGHKNF